MDEADPVEVPYDAIQPSTLRALIAEFVTRDGTDYGAREASLERKIDDVLRQLERGEAKVVFDPNTTTANILPRGLPRPG